MADYRDHISQEMFEQIESYLLQRMDAAQRQAFEQAIANDVQLRNEVALQRKLMATVEAGSFLDEQPGADTATTPAVPAPVRTMNRRWWYAAAAVLILAIGATWWLRKTETASQDLYTQYFHADPGLPVAMSSTNAYTFYDGMVSYKEGKYKEAAAMWTKLGNEKGFTDTLQYFIGVAHLNSNALPEANQYLLPVANNSTSVWKDKATWYLALSYIKADNRTEAVRWLTQLPNDERAKQLLAEPALRQPGK
jgi:hypothetical protein